MGKKRSQRAALNGALVPGRHGTSREVDLAGALPGPIFEPLADPAFFAQVHVDHELGTVVWPNGADLDPLVLHGDFEPAAGTVHH